MGDETIHLRHSIDGYPLCWPMDRDGSFDATSQAGGVTCDDCKTLMTDDDGVEVMP